VQTNGQGYWSTTDSYNQIQYYKATFAGDATYATSSAEMTATIAV
jgi:hypothetical protein